MSQGILRERISAFLRTVGLICLLPSFAILMLFAGSAVQHSLGSRSTIIDLLFGLPSAAAIFFTAVASTMAYVNLIQGKEFPAIVEIPAWLLSCIILIGSFCLSLEAVFASVKFLCQSIGIEPIK